MEARQAIGEGARWRRISRLLQRHSVDWCYPAVEAEESDWEGYGTLPLLFEGWEG
jgi:hypothetical protein